MISVIGIVHIYGLSKIIDKIDHNNYHYLLVNNYFYLIL